MPLFRNYKTLPVNEATDEELLYELLRRNNVASAPLKRTFHTPHSEVVLGIGNDDIAWVTLDTGSFEVLKNRVRESNTLDGKDD